MRSPDYKDQQGAYWQAVGRMLIQLTLHGDVWKPTGIVYDMKNHKYKKKVRKL